jgi:hypothetical protein
MHKDSNGVIVCRIREEMGKLWPVFQSIGGEGIGGQQSHIMYRASVR